MPTVTEQGSAANSNLWGYFRGRDPSRSDSDIATQVSGILGSANEEQLGRWSRNLFNENEFGGTSGAVANPPNPVSSTDGIRDDMTLVTGNATNALGEMVEGVGLADSMLNIYEGIDVGEAGGGIATAESELTTLAAGLGVLTPQEEQEINQAGEAAYGEYLPLIQEAEESKRVGLPKAVIGAGERGGFMSTQFAGGAALQTTEGGDFLGEGGELNRIKSDYDRNISMIKGQANQARLIAQAAARQAIRTGKREDYEVMERAVDRMKQTSRDLLAVAKAKSDAIYQYAQFRQNSITFRNGLADRDKAIKEGDEDRVIAAEDRLKEQAANQFNTALKFLGIDGIKKNQTQLENMFREAGFTDIDFNDVITQLEAEAEKARIAGLPKPELRTLGNQLLAVTFDEKTGEYSTKVLATSKTGGSGGSSSTKITSGQRTILQRVMPSSEIDQLAKDIAAYGVATVLEQQEDDDVRAAIQEAFGEGTPEPEPQDKQIDIQLAEMGWPPKAIRRFKQDQEDQGASLDPNTWKAQNEGLFKEAISGGSSIATPNFSI